MSFSPGGRFEERTVGVVRRNRWTASVRNHKNFTHDALTKCKNHFYTPVQRCEFTKTHLERVKAVRDPRIVVTVGDECMPNTLHTSPGGPKRNIGNFF